MVRAEHPFPMGERLLMQGDGPAQISCRLVSVGRLLREARVAVSLPSTRSRSASVASYRGNGPIVMADDLVAAGLIHPALP